MFPKEIIEIIQKYQNTNTLQSINDHIDSIRRELSDVNNNITEQLYMLMDRKDIDSQESELLEASQELRIFMSTISTIDIEKDNCKLISAESEIQKSEDATCEQNLEEKPMVYVAQNMMCRECKVGLTSHMIHYKNNDILSGIWWYKCPKCNKLYCIDSEIKEFDFSQTNIVLNFDLSESSFLKEINMADTIVLSTLRHCTYQEHEMEDVIANIPIYNENGNVEFITVNITYCYACKKYIMLKSDYKLISGVIACQVVDNTVIRNGSCEDSIEASQHESILYKYGYNVKTKENLSDKQRHIILASVVESNVLTRDQICSHLDTLIDRGSKIDKWKTATQKWKQDRQYIKNYNTNNLPQILLDKVILKYSINK